MRFDPLRPGLITPPGGARKPPRDLVWLWMLILVAACIAIVRFVNPALR